MSRLFWNELFIDLTQSEEVRRNSKAQKLLNETNWGTLKESTQIDYEQVAKLKRQVLEAACSNLSLSDISSDKRLLDYAAFRATQEKNDKSWHVWNETQKNGNLTGEDFDVSAQKYHVFVQGLFNKQISKLRDQLKTRGPGLYLDFPLGVHPDGYDVWKHQSLFALGASTGAPPDPFFIKGQDWGFAPPRPSAIRLDGYKYFRECLQNHLKYAGVLRLDHVMAFTRLFWIPWGLPAHEGVYVSYQPEEFYAIICLESLRHQAIVVGEDLGTVPEEVRHTMHKRNIHRMQVLQFEVGPNASQPFQPIVEDCVASINTHDMPTFAGFWNKRDIADRKSSNSIF